MVKLAASLAAASILFVAAPASAAVAASTVTAQDAFEAPLLVELNRVRAHHGLVELTASRRRPFVASARQQEVERLIDLA